MKQEFDNFEIVNASPVGLTCKTFRILIMAIEEMIEGLNMMKNKVVALQAIRTLSCGLNIAIPISQELLTLYLYIQRVIATNKEEEYEECVAILHNLLEAYEAIELEELKKRPPVNPTYGNYGAEDIQVGKCASFQA